MHSPDSVSSPTGNSYALLVDAISDYALYMLDPKGHVLTWNHGAARMQGYAADEIVGRDFSCFFSDKDRADDLPARTLRIAAREGRFECECWQMRKDGSLLFVHSVTETIRDPQGALTGYARVARDITKSKQSEQAFQMLVQGVKDCAIYMLDPKGIITNWNTGAQAIKGYAADEIVGKHFSIFYTEEDRAGGVPEKALGRALEDGKFEKEAWRVRKDGSLFWANVLIDPIFDESGAHVGFAKVTRDMSERKRVAEELEEARAALLQSQKLHAIGELTGGVAHDFNNLLTVIGGAADMLLQQHDLPEEKRRRYLEAIADTVRRATTLTGHLLAFSRRRVIHPEVIDLNIRLDAISELLSRTLGSRVRVEISPQARDARVEVDPTELETAILNAAVNARDAMPEGGTLTIETVDARHQKQPAVCIAIRDTGTGMAPDQVERAFEPFFTTKPVGKGTGLGLSQIHGFAAQAGGAAELTSKPGQGTTLHIILPRVDKPLTTAETDGASATLPAGLRILLVEDNALVREMARQLLIDLDTQVTTATNGREALAAMEAETFDLVFTDVVMPELSGVDLARALAESHPHLPVLLATGYSDQVIGADAQSLAVIAKPYNKQSLSAAICGLLATRSEKALRLA